MTRISPDASRIRWSLNGPLETSISIVQIGREFDPDEVPEPYYLGDKDGHEGNPTWHPFSRSPLSEPKVSSTKLWVNPLDDWDYFWWVVHEGHTEPDATYDPAEVLYESPPEGDPYPEEKKLVRCCGEDAPPGKGTDLVVRATGDGGFVTVHDFLSAVHPYLMSRRDEILEAMALDVGRPGKRPFGRETKLIVTWMNPGQIDVQTADEFMRFCSKVRPDTSAPHDLDLDPAC
ncbi:hypothetical protein NKR19_g5527 [Coniochaeta hoffmannii]|uniref:Protein HRI1 n=1 Tax=Coniochaeta hoffmannii TaxID=91930 RepID=A0AA38RK03_9PEZI|nr:hypothetical protein NKR19_g5527 [Coniochaeta hoffmannii]